MRESRLPSTLAKIVKNPQGADQWIPSKTNSVPNQPSKPSNYYSNSKD